MLKSSVGFPQIEMSDDPIRVRDFVQAVEGLGFNCLHVPDMEIGATQTGQGA